MKIRKGKEIFGTRDEDIYIEMAVDVVQGGNRLPVNASYPMNAVTQGFGDWPQVNICNDYDFSSGDNREITGILKVMMDEGVPMLLFFIHNERQNHTWESYFKDIPHIWKEPYVKVVFDEKTKEAINRLAEGLEIEIEDVGNF